MVRLQQIEIYNLKNVGKGCVKFSSHTQNEAQSDILGIYGQNGSGKTTLVLAVSLLKDLLMGKPLDRDCGNYIKSGEDSALLHVEFMICDALVKYKVIYEFELRKKEHGTDGYMDEEDLQRKTSAYLSSEKISMSKFYNGKWSKMTPVLCYDENSGILPQNRYKMLTHGERNQEDEIRVLKLLAMREGRSFLFAKELALFIEKSEWDDDYKNIFEILNVYAIYSLHVFRSEDTGFINANIALPLSFVLKDKNTISLLKGSLNLDGISMIPRKFFGAIESKMKTISMVLKEIIPGLTIYLKEINSILDKNGEEVIRVQVMAKRHNVEIPLMYESDGIKKLVSVLYCLILVFNDNSATLVVDEFDSGVFEYLLGEILKVVEECGKGQLIFTSHNLRPLEVLNSKNIMFTTTNENNRYIRFKNIKANNNFRDVYFHDILLGGQNECIYEATNPYMIAKAFRTAGDESVE